MIYRKNMSFTNIKLYGDIYKDRENKHSYFDFLYYNPNIVINTWKNLIFNKSKNEYNCKQTASTNIHTNNIKKIRYENALWRTWFMQKFNKKKIKFTYNNIHSNILQGPVVLI